MKSGSTYLVSEEVLIIHDYLIQKFGGSRGIRDFGLLESALARPGAGMIAFEAYPDLFLKAAVLCHSLIKNHPFVDGNKRTAVVATVRFLQKNNVSLALENGELVQLVLAVENDSLNEEGIAEWLRDHQADKL